MLQRTRLTTSIASVALGLAFVASPAKADAIADFYKGKNLTFLVGYSAGGSFGFYARLLAEHMSKHMPGKPNIVVQHMPGGGSLKAANYLYNAAPKDGSMVAFLSETLPITQRLRPKKAKYDVSKMSWIGSMVPVNPVIMVRKGSPAQTIKELQNKEVNVACSGRGSQSFLMPSSLKQFVGFKWKLICGYKGSAPMTLALERGEVDVQSSAWISWRIRYMDNIKAGDLTPIVQVGLKRERELPNIPLMQDLTDDPKIKAVLKFVSSGAPIGRSVVGPANVPADRVAALRKAFDATMKDPVLLAEAKKRNAPVDATPGAVVEKIVMEVFNTSDDVVTLARDGMTGYKQNCTKNCTKKKKKKKKEGS